MMSELVSRVRRNHALEHATIHILAERHKNFSAQGNAEPGGFHLNIYGEVSADEVASAVDEAYLRLQQGERQLAVHPNCGTVLLTMATLAALAAQATFSLEQRRQRRGSLNLPVLFNALPTAVIVVALSLVAGRPLGIALQAAYTVEPELGDLQVVRVRRTSPSAITRFFQLLLGQARNEHVQSFQVDTIG